MENDVLDMVLHDIPSFWAAEPTSAYYDSYRLYDISEGTNEYNLVKNSLYEYASNIRKIQRIQNPYQLGLFKIMKEKRDSEGRDIAVHQKYHVILPEDLTTSLKYPLDYRRYKHKIPLFQEESKQAKFFEDPVMAIVEAVTRTASEIIILIQCDCLNNVTNQGEYNPNISVDKFLIIEADCCAIDQLAVPMENEIRILLSCATPPIGAFVK